MSGRTVPRFALIGLLAATLTAPAVAQEGGFQFPRNPEPVPVAPMPRAVGNNTCTYDFAALRALIYEADPVMPTPVPPELPVPTMTPPVPPTFAEVAPSVRIVVPQLGPLTQAVDFPFPQSRSANHRQAFNLSVGLFGQQSGGSSCGIGSYCAPALPRLVAPAQRQQFAMNDAPRIILIGGEDAFVPAPTCPPCPLPRIVANPLLGTWYREMPSVVTSATFTHDELKLCMTQSADGHTAVITITAHYTITKDGLVYGAITGADADMKRSSKAGQSPFDAELVELQSSMQSLVDAPFSFRTKLTSAGLMVSGLKCSTPMSRGESDIFGGMYKHAKDGKVPAPVSVSTTNKADAPVIGAAAGGSIGTTAGALIGNDTNKLVPATPDCQRVGIDFNTNPPVMSLPVPPGASHLPYLDKLYKNVEVAAPRPTCEAPSTGGDSTKQMALEAFGQLLQQSGITRPITDPRVMGGMTLPSGRYLEHYPQYFAPDPAFPLSRELACPSAATPPGPNAPIHGMYIPTPTTPSFVGTWYRDVAGKRCAVKIAPDHLTLTVSETHEENGKVSVASLVITADYHLTRDGSTAVGLITSVDVSFEGEFPQEDAKPFFEMLNELQKALEDKPFAVTFHVYDLSLVIGNVRMPSVSDNRGGQPAGYMAGRYKSAGVQMPKPKAIKVNDRNQLGGFGSPPAPYYPTPTGTQGLTVPQTITYPERVAPPPILPAPNGDLLPLQTIPSPRIVPSSGSWTPSMTEPTPPVPQMPQPVRPGK